MTRTTTTQTTILKNRDMNASLINGTLVDLIFPAEAEHFVIPVRSLRPMLTGKTREAADLVLALRRFCQDADRVDLAVEMFGSESH